jgi:hypothetical protein
MDFLDKLEKEELMNNSAKKQPRDTMKKLFIETSGLSHRTKNFWIPA